MTASRLAILKSRHAACHQQPPLVHCESQPDIIQRQALRVLARRAESIKSKLCRVRCSWSHQADAGSAHSDSLFRLRTSHRNGQVPASGGIKQFSGSDDWLRDLARRELFAIRQGVFKFLGLNLKKIPISSTILTDDGPRLTSGNRRRYAYRTRYCSRLG